MPPHPKPAVPKPTPVGVTLRTEANQGNGRAKGGVARTTTVTTRYRLLHRPGNTGRWTEVATGVSLSEAVDRMVGRGEWWVNDLPPA